MDALILAAGYGSRLRPIEPCKPLTHVNGISLLEISIRQLMSVGASKIVVATGYRAQEVENSLSDISKRHSVEIITRRVPDYSKPNGHSILAAADALSDQFFLVMADHIFARDTLRQLAGTQLGGNDAVLAIDRRVDSDLVDPDDATWVRTDGTGQIVAIGKDIDRYDAVDCGAFMVNSGLIDAIKSSVAQGKAGSLSDGMQELADRGKAGTCDIGSSWWLDVDEAQSLHLAKQQVPSQLPELFQENALFDDALQTMASAS